VLSANAPLAFEVLGDAAARPAFPEKEVELLRTQTLSGLQLELSQPASLASRFFARELYGRNPYARRPTPTSVQGLTRADLVSFQKSRLRPGGALLVVAGDITMADVRRLATQAFAGWTGATPTTLASVAPPPRTKREIVLVHRPGSVQSNIVVGNTTFGPADPRFYATTVANKVLGGGADSRLFMILREQKSWTYGAYSNLDRPRGIGAFQATAEVRTEVTDSALVELLSQLRRLGTEPVPATELEAAKGALVGSFPLTIETADQVAAAVSRAKLLGLPANYLQTYRPRLAAVTPVALQQAARASIRPEAALIVVVGDGTKIYDRLAAIAPVRVVSVDGTTIGASELKASATAAPARLDLDFGRLVARQDSFAVVMQGNPVGSMRTALEKTATGGYRFTDATQIMAAIQQSTELTFSGNGEMQAVKQTGKVQGQDVKVDVSYAGGRAKGSALTPSREGIKQVAVDAALPAGAIDDNALQALVPALKWGPSAKFAMSVFSPGKTAVRPMTLAVVGTEKVTVPAGTFDVYKAELTGGDQPMTMYVTTTTPNRVVKMAIVGTPLEIVLVK
jgi:zinc protease